MYKYTTNNLYSNTFQKNVEEMLRKDYDVNCGAFIFSLVISNLQWDVRIRDFFMLIFWTTM